MNRSESLQVLRKTVAYQPSQRMDELTASAWTEALEPYDVADALEAVHELGTAPRRDGEPWMFELRDIIAVVCAKRSRRFDARKHLVVPPREVDDDPAAYRRWVIEIHAELCRREWNPPAAIDAPSRPTGAVVGRLAEALRADR